MTMDQLNKIRLLLEKREYVKEELKKLGDISEMIFTLARTGGKQLYYAKSDMSYFSSQLDSEVVEACQKAAQKVFIDKIEDLTAQLKKLGLEE